MEESFRFCAGCGTSAIRVQQPPEASETPEVSELSESSELPEVSEVSEVSESSELPEEPELMQIYKEDKKGKKVKTDFGKGALAFCLAVIALLSVVSGMFIGLYITERDKNAYSAARNRGGAMSYYGQHWQ